MKSPETKPTVAALEVTPEPIEEEPDNGGLGHLPIGISEGDFSTPTKRTRTITRPRGLRTLEQPVPAPSALETPLPVDVVVAPASQTPRHQASVVDEFLAAPPTPIPELQETPAPALIISTFSAPIDLALEDPVNEIEDLPLTEEGEELVGTPAPAPIPDPMADGIAQQPLDWRPEWRADSVDRVDPVAPQMPAPMVDPLKASSAQPENQATEAVELPSFDVAILPDQAGEFVAAMSDGVTATSAADVPLDATEQVAMAEDIEFPDDSDPLPEPVPDPSPEPVPDPSPDSPLLVVEVSPLAGVARDSHAPGAAAELFEAASLAAAAPPLEAGPPDRPEPAPEPASEAEPELSPLAQTLANMAESMQGEVVADTTLDLDISDAPLVPLSPSSAGPPVPPPPTPIPRPVPPPLPAAATGLVEVPAPAVLPDSRPPVAATLAHLPEALAERPRRPKRSRPWFEEVFDESYLRTLPFMTAEQTLQEVDFIESSLAVPRGSEVLDVACGYGRHAIELVQRGLAVTGIDLSLPLLIRAADESQRRSVSVNFVHADMREISFERQFDGAYCMLTSFGYFDDESNLKVAEGIARALKPGGRFLIDVVNRDYIVGDLPARIWWEGDGCVVLEEVDFNFNTNRILTHRSVVFEDGHQLEQEISIRVYSLHELGKLLRQAGFRVIEVSGTIPARGQFFGTNSRNLLLLAERRTD